MGPWRRGVEGTALGSPGPSEEPQRFLQAAGHVVCRCPELGSTPASVCICVCTVRRACLCRCTAAPLVRGGCVPGPPVDARNRGQRQTPRALGPAVHVRVGHRTRGTATTSDHAMSSVTSYVVWSPATRQRMVLCVRHGRTGQQGAQSRGHHAAQRSPQFKMNGFISGVSHLLCLGPGRV